MHKKEHTKEHNKESEGMVHNHNLKHAAHNIKEAGKKMKSMKAHAKKSHKA